MKLLLVMVWCLTLMARECWGWGWMPPGTGSLEFLDVGFNGEYFLAAFGDFDSDRLTDVFVVDDQRRTVRVFLCNPDSFQYRLADHAAIRLAEGEEIVSVVPSDYNGDGRLDLLVSFRRGAGQKYFHHVHLGNGTGFFAVIDNLPSTQDEVTLVDFHGNLRSDLLVQIEEPCVVTVGTRDIQPLSDRGFCRMLANPHSNAVVDLDGDCIPDLFLTCMADKNEEVDGFRVTRGDLFIEIWLGKADGGYRAGKRVLVPFKHPDVSLIALHDMNGDGSPDMVMHTADHMHVFYNTQRPYCGSGFPHRDCKPSHDLCVADPGYGFDMDLKGKDHIAVPFSLLLGDRLSVVRTDHHGSMIPIRAGDFNLDGFPDIVLIASEAKTGDGRWHKSARAVVLTNIPCASGSCSPIQVEEKCRTFTASSPITSQLKSIQGVWAAASFVFGHSGMAGIVFSIFDPDNDRIGILAMLNPYYQDAFFLRIAMCRQMENDRRLYGINYPGAAYKYSFVDFDGYTRVRSASQYTQTSRMALMMPEVFVGLGRINTFVDVLAAGAPLGSSPTARWGNIIPNSNLYIFPPTSNDTLWRIELHINPGEYTLWILVSLAASLLVLAVTILVLRRIEMNQDMREKRESLHAIHFDAL